MNIIEKLYNYEDFSNSEKVAAVFIAENIDLCLRSSVDKIGDLSFTSGSTISRVIKKLGFDSYNDFKVALAKDQETHRWKLDVNIPFSSDDSTGQVVERMKELYIQSISDVIDNIDSEQLMKAVRLIASCREVSLYGKGPSFYICEDFVEKLRRISIKSYYFTSPNEIWTQANTQNDKDLAIIVSFYGRSRVYERFCRYLQEKKTKVITVTGVEGNNLSRIGDVNICCKSKEKYDKIASFESRNEMQFVMDLLYCFVFKLNYDYNLIKIKENMDGIYAVREGIE